MEKREIREKIVKTPKCTTKPPSISWNIEKKTRKKGKNREFHEKMGKGEKL